MEIEPIGLQHQSLICDKFYQLDLGLSEYSFANVYLFRKKHDYRLMRGKNLYVRGVHHDGCSYVMITEPVQTLDVQELFEVLCGVDYFYPVPESWRELFSEEYFVLSRSEADSDYVYTLEKMRYYPGRKLSGKRNLVKQFLENYNCRAEKLDAGRVDDARSILEAWKNALEEPDPADIVACNEALDIWGRLKRQEGRIYYIDDKAAGFVIGGPLSLGTYVIDFMKGIKDYKGIYQYMYQEYALQLPDTVKMINLEQDLGKPQLAQAKHSYEPDALYVKLRVALQPDLKKRICTGTFTPPALWWSNELLH